MPSTDIFMDRGLIPVTDIKLYRSVSAALLTELGLTIRSRSIISASPAIARTLAAYFPGYTILTPAPSVARALSLPITSNTLASLLVHRGVGLTSTFMGAVSPEARLAVFRSLGLTHSGLTVFAPTISHFIPPHILAALDELLLTNTLTTEDVVEILTTEGTITEAAVNDASVYGATVDEELVTTAASDSSLTTADATDS